MRNKISFKRVTAYFIDLLIVSFLCFLLSNIKVLNPNYDKYIAASEEYRDVFNELLNDNVGTLKIDSNVEKIMYDVSYYGVSYLIIEFSVIVLYYSLFSYFFNGQTIGKRILKLQVVDSKTKKKLSLGRYFLRSLIYPDFSSAIFYCSLTLFLNIVSLFILKQNYFLSINRVFVIAGLAWCYLDVIYGMVNKENKMLHDVLLKTTVIEIGLDKEEVVSK